MSNRWVILCAVLAACGSSAPAGDDDGEADATPGAADAGPRADAGAIASCIVPDDTAGHVATTTPHYAKRMVDLARHPHAVCNDGTPLVYGIRRNPASTRWLIFLEGGGFCADDVTCRQRWSHGTNPTLMSSLQFQQASTQNQFDGVMSAQARGILAADPVENPTFHDANIVKIPYCSSDTWMGDAAGDDSQPTTSVARWHFRGHAIVQAVVSDLLADDGLDQATDVTLAGGSAGGAGVYANVDDVGAMLPAGVRYLGLPDAGFFIVYPELDPGTGVETTTHPWLMERISLAARSSWQGRGDASCDAAASDELGKILCYGAETMTRGHITTPLLIVQNRFDQNQILRLDPGGMDDLTGQASSPGDEAYIRRFADSMGSRLMGVDAIHSIFSDWTWWHITVTGATGDDVPESTIRLEVDGHSLRDVIDAWHTSPCSPMRLIEAPQTDVP